MTRGKTPHLPTSSLPPGSSLPQNLAALAACAAFCACATAAPCPVAAPPPPAPPPVASAPLPAGPQPFDGFSVLLRPTVTPAAAVHVELELAGRDAPRGPWHLLRGTPASVLHATARDGAGDLAVAATQKGDGVDLALSRAATGPVHIAYEVLTSAQAPDDPLGVLVLDDRFRGSGGALVAVPESLERVSMPVQIRIDGGALKASGAASSLGVGNARRTTMPLVGFAYTTFLAGSLGGLVVDDPGKGHDEGAWLGATAFDARTMVAELSRVRSTLHEQFDEPPEDPWTYLVVTQTRPIGSFSTTPRWASTLLQVGPAEPWSGALRLSMAQQLARHWIGAELSVATGPALDAEGWWFAEGVSRFVAMATLAHLGLLPPDDVRYAVAGEIGVVATSPHRTLDNAHLAEKAESDPVARATLMARGALYALRESAQIRARTKGQRGLGAALVALRKRAEASKERRFSVTDWIGGLAKDDPDAARTFEAVVMRGDPPTLPANTLGPCFRAGTGDYAAYDAGFDVEATRASESGQVVGLRAGGPAAKAGLAAGDVVESMQGRDGDADVAVKLSVVRAGSRIALSYSPRGAVGRGQTWTRVPGLRDDQCGELP
jgi:hypothetical protein